MLFTPNRIPSLSGHEQNLSTFTLPTDRSEPRKPPSSVLLCTGTVGIRSAKSPCPVGISTLPTTLIHLIKSWLIDKETMQLLYTNRYLHAEVQSYYRVRLRATVALESVSPIASYQESVNCIPSVLLLDEEGELTYQQCLAMKVDGRSESDYCSAVMQLLKTCLAESMNPT